MLLRAEHRGQSELRGLTELACKVSRRSCLQRGDCSRIQISMSNLIREATSNDAAGLASLIREAFADVARRFGLTPENCPTHPSNCQAFWIERELAEGCRYWILEDDSLAVGCISVERVDKDLFHLKRLAVLPASRRRGFGEALVRHVLGVAEAAGAGCIELHLIADHQGLERWYAKLGFRFTHRSRYEHLPFAVTEMRWTGWPSSQSQVNT